MRLFSRWIGGNKGIRSQPEICILLCVVILFAWSFPGPVQSQTYGFRASYEDDGTSVLRTFRIWAPPDVSSLRGAVFLWAGAGQDWRDRVGWESFQHAAQSLGFALIGTLDNELGQTTSEVDAALQQIMTAAAEVSGRAELENAPVVLTGFSQGGYRSSRGAALSSGRVIALVGHKGAQIVELSDEGKQVPALFIAGELDGNFSPEFIRQVFQDWRNQDGLSAYTVDWNVGHDDLGNQGWEATWYWISEVVRLRYPEGVLPSTTPGELVTLQDIPLESGWLADKPRFLSDGTPFITDPFFNIAPFEDYEGSSSAASWLPSQSVAYMYRAFTSTDEEERSEVPYQTPLRIQSPEALDTLTVDRPILIEIDPRGFADTTAIQSIELFVDSTMIGLADSGSIWTIPYVPSDKGIHAITAIATDASGNKRTTFRTVTVLSAGTITSISDSGIENGAVILHSNYPNPFKESTMLHFELPQAAQIHIEVFDALGRRVTTLLQASRQAGTHTINFDAQGLATGTYYYSLTVDQATYVRPILLVK